MGIRNLLIRISKRFPRQTLTKTGKMVPQTALGGSSAVEGKWPIYAAKFCQFNRQLREPPKEANFPRALVASNGLSRSLKAHKPTEESLPYPRLSEINQDKLQNETWKAFGKRPDKKEHIE